MQLVAASFVEGSLKMLADYIGPHKILWATDYPHSDGFFPGAPKMMMDRPRRSVPGDQARGHGRRGNGLLRAKLVTHGAYHLGAPISTAGLDRHYGKR
jgi:hypothetical protein